MTWGRTWRKLSKKECNGQKIAVRKQKRVTFATERERERERQTVTEMEDRGGECEVTAGLVLFT